MSDEFYFCLELTEGEHCIVHSEIYNYSSSHELELVYYRKLKDGHIPCYREVKVAGNIVDLNRFKDFVRNVLEVKFLKNPHKIKNEQ